MWFALTLDQRQSRSSEDAVEASLKRYNADKHFKLARKFERTAGDEMQALVQDPTTVVDLVLDAIRSQIWWIGIGCGGVDEPLPRSVRASSGEALENARIAVERAKSKSERHHFFIVGTSPLVEDLTAIFMLLAVIIERQSPRAKSAAELDAKGLSQREASQRLGISQQSFSERLRRAYTREERAGRDLAIRIVDSLARQ
jgi:hypothetical protein